MFSRSLLESFSGDSIAIFIKEERLLSPMRFLNRVLIIFIWEKLLSTEAVPTEIKRHLFASLFKSGNIVSSIFLVANSFNCLHIVFCFFGKDVAKGFPFCMEFTIN